MTGARVTCSFKAAAVAALLVLSSGPVSAELRPSLNMYGATGLIDMPSGQVQPDGALSFTTSYFGKISRNTLSFQMTPRLSGSFRYSGVWNWDRVVPSAFKTYYDRSFDLRYQLLDEGRYVPSVVIGLQDIAGTGLNSGEYVAASKRLGPKLTVTGGLGWGRLGSHGAIGSPFGPRKPIVVGRGGSFNFDQWFRGPVAPFAGVEWQVSDRLTFKAEYSSDAYTQEAGLRRVFDRNSPMNFGLEYQASKRVRIGAYAMHGSEIGLSLNFTAVPRDPVTPLKSSSPLPIRVRPLNVVGSDEWSTDWLKQSDAKQILTANVAGQLALDNIKLHSLNLTGTTAELRIIDEKMDSRANAIGRAARAMAYMLPASVEEFRIIPVINGQQTTAVTVRRSDLEQFETASDPASSLWAVTRVEDAMRYPMPAAQPGVYPKLSWSLTPFFRASYFDPRRPIRLETGLRAQLSYKTEKGFEFAGSIRKPVASTLDDPRPRSNSVLPHVRTDAALYDRNADPALEFLTVSKTFRPGDNLYGRVTVGYLEPMFAGVSGEILWKPPASRFALGTELNYVRQRDTDMLFGLRNYSVVTGHVSAYADLGGGYEAQLDVGRYLAGDMGATLSLDRDFGNGWRIGVFATKTNVSAAQFGEGSFDKGIRINVPMTWFTGQPNQTRYSMQLRPILRDGGARLDVRNRLYDTLRNDDSSSYGQQWSRFWR
jgi:hypothetical protein